MSALREILRAQVRAEMIGAAQYEAARKRKPRSSGLAKRGHEFAVLKLTEDKRYSHTHSKERRP